MVTKMETLGFLVSVFHPICMGVLNLQNKSKKSFYCHYSEICYILMFSSERGSKCKSILAHKFQKHIQTFKLMGISL